MVVHVGTCHSSKDFEMSTACAHVSKLGSSAQRGHVGQDFVMMGSEKQFCDETFLAMHA